MLEIRTSSSSHFKGERERYIKQDISKPRSFSVMTSPKVVLVTGGNNGIGYETVKALLQSKLPYHVLLGSRSLDKAELAIGTLHNECPDSISTVEAVQCDLTSDESIEKAFEQIRANQGHIDVLINNAGMYRSPKPNQFHKD